MTPTKMSTATTSSPTTTKTSVDIRRRTSARYSILSDPRLSQLFALSSQLEALAQTIELEAASAVDIDVPTSDLTTTTSPSPPALPPKPKFASSSFNDRSNGNVVVVDVAPRPKPAEILQVGINSIKLFTASRKYNCYL